MSEVETPKELLRRIYDEEFGFIPTNTSMKPVHVANGLARRVLGKQTDFRPLARLLRQYVDNQRGGFKEERNPNSAILTDYGDRFTDRFGNPPSDDAMTRFRSLAKDTLGADETLDEYNLFILMRTKIRSERPLPTGRVTLEVQTVYAEARPGGPLDITITADGDQIASGRVPVSVPLLFTANDCLDIGTCLGSPVSLDYRERAPFAFEGRIHGVHVAYT